MASLLAKPRFLVESDVWGDDWPAFPTVDECWAYMRQAAREIAMCNIGPDGLGNCPAFLGLTVDQIVGQLLEEHGDCIVELG